MTIPNTDVLRHVNLTLVDSTEKAAQFMSWLGQQREVLGVDTETGGFKCHRDRLRLVQFGDKNQGWAIPWERWGGVAVEAMEKYTGPITLFNSRFDAGFMRHHAKIKWPWHRTHDVMTMSHLSRPTLPHGLKDLSAILVDPQAAAAQRILAEAMATHKWTWDTVPIDFAPYWVYGAMDPVLTCHLQDHFSGDVFTKYKWVYDLEMSVTRIISNMELKGARVDLDYCMQARIHLMDYVARARAWARDAYGIENVGSNKQVIELFERIGRTIERFTDAGNKSVDKYQLQLFSFDPSQAGADLASTILSIRSAEKNTAPYFDNFLEMAVDGMVHATIWPLGTRTARMSVTEPALQTLPKKSPVVRDAFIPEVPGEQVLITCDYDQIEMRLLAHFSGDAGLIGAFEHAAATGGDFFVNLANQIYQTNDVQRENDRRRDLTKNTAYGKAYGAGVQKMAETAGVPFDIMSDVNERFNSSYPNVRVFQDEVGRVGAMRLHTEGEPYVITPYGRRLPSDRDKAYALVNYLIQSHAAEILKLKMVELDAVGVGDYMVLPVHDELVSSVPADQAEEIKHVIETTMADVTNYRVPITASADIIPDRWGSKYRKAS